MEIIEQDGLVLLADCEVFHHLNTTGSTSPASNHARKKRVPQSVLTIEFELLEYLKGRPMLAFEQLASLLEALKQFKLSKAERLQVVNLLPESAVEFHMIVEECEERFSKDNIEAILSMVHKVVVE